MAEFLSNGCMRRTGWAAAACLLATVAVAQGLSDPTRPPIAQDYSQESSAPALQSVLISNGRAEAIISGHLVRVGEQVGDATVVSIREAEVVLGHGTEFQTLKLFPSIEKRPAPLRQAATKPGNRGQEK